MRDELALAADKREVERFMMILKKLCILAVQ